MTKLKLGINRDISNDDYHADRTYFSSSVLKTLLKDKQLFYNEYILKTEKAPKKESSALILGSYVHTLILEPHLHDEEYIVFDGASRNSNKYREFKAENTDKTIILEKEVNHANKMVDMYNKRPEAKQLIDGGEAEISLTVELENLPIKVRADYMNVDKGYIVDVKTASEGAHKSGVIEASEKWNYMLSASLYLMAFEKHYGKPFDFYWIFLGKYDPMQCHVYKMSKRSRDKGTATVMDALSKYKLYSKENSWFDYVIEEI